jgi:hypothetical protein
MNYYSQLLGRRRMIDIKRAGYNIELPAPLDNIPFSKSSERENIEENVCRCLLHSKTIICTFKIMIWIHFKYCSDVLFR